MKAFLMRLRCASAPRFLNCVPDDRAEQGSSPSGEFFFSFINSPSFSLLFVFLLIPNFIFSSTVRGLTKFKTRRSLSN